MVVGSQIQEKMKHEKWISKLDTGEESRLKLNLLSVLMKCESWVIHNIGKENAVWQKNH